MKTISLIPLTSGTGICHFVCCFALIEKDNVVILDLTSESILVDMLKADEVLRFGNVTLENISDNGNVKFHRTRFNNKLITLTNHTSENSQKKHINSIHEFFTKQFKNEDSSYFIIYCNYQKYSINEIVKKCDYTVFFLNYTVNASLALKDFFERFACNKCGILLSGSKDEKFSIQQFKEDLKNYKIDLFGEIPFNFLFQLATIQKRVLLEMHDKSLSESTLKLWTWIKYNANSLSKMSFE